MCYFKTPLIALGSKILWSMLGLRINKLLIVAKCKIPQNMLGLKLRNFASGFKILQSMLQKLYSVKAQLTGAGSEISRSVLLIVR